MPADPGIRLLVGMGDAKQRRLIKDGTDELKSQRKIGCRKATRHRYGRKAGEVAKRETSSSDKGACR